MNTIAPSHRGQFVRLLLAFFTAALLASASTASAQVTYTLVPVVFSDLNNPSNTDTVTGTITLSGTGVYTTSNLASADLTFTLTMASSSMSITPETAIGSGDLFFEGTLTATPTALTISSNGDLNIQGGGAEGGDPYVNGYWDANDNAISFYAGTLGPPATMQIFNTDADASYFGNPPWTIATAIPEPGSATLAFLGGLGLLALRRKRKM